MNIRLLMIVLIVAMGASFARNTISWNTQTETWVKYFESGVNNHHRSGLVHETDKTFDENAPLSELPDGEENAPSGKMAKLWRTGALGEYKAIYAAPSEKMVAFLKKKCFKNLDIAKEQYEPKEGIFTLGIEPEPIPFENLPYTDISQVTKKARTLAKKHLNAFKGRIEYENHEIDFIEMYGQEKINKIRLRFRRIFNGGIVLRNISYVYLILDGNGDPISLEIKWPQFEPVSEETECKPVSEGFNEAVEYFEDLPPFISNTLGAEEVKATHVDITGAALGWYPLEEGREEGVDQIITPVYSFIGKVTLETGETIYRFFESNVLTRYERE